MTTLDAIVTGLGSGAQEEVASGACRSRLARRAGPWSSLPAPPSRPAALHRFRKEATAGQGDAGARSSEFCAQYLAASPECVELFNVWEGQQQVRLPPGHARARAVIRRC